MKRWFERGGWILILAAIIFISFCLFADISVGPDSDVRIPLLDDVNLFAYTVYASESESEIEIPADISALAEQQTPQANPELPITPDEGVAEITEESVISEPYAETVENQSTELISGVDYSQDITEIKVLLQVFLGIILLAICGLVVYIILRPLWWFTFY